MTELQQKALTENLEGILKFFQYGKDGAPNPPRPGRFIEMFRAEYPVDYEENKDLIYLIDRLVLAAFNAGKQSNAPPKHEF